MSEGFERRLWIFQMPPDAWRDWMRHLEAGLEPVFELTRFKREVRGGDGVLLWVSGKDAGVHGTSRVVGVPGRDPALSGLGYEAGGGAIWAHLDAVEILADPISRKSLKEDPTFSAASIIRSPMGMVHQLKPAQEQRIRGILSGR